MLRIDALASAKRAPEDGKALCAPAESRCKSGPLIFKETDMKKPGSP